MHPIDVVLLILSSVGVLCLLCTTVLAIGILRQAFYVRKLNRDAETGKLYKFPKRQ